MIQYSHLKHQTLMLTIRNKEAVQENEELTTELEEFNCFVENELNFWYWVSFDRFVDNQELKEELEECKNELDDLKKKLKKTENSLNDYEIESELSDDEIVKKRMDAYEKQLKDKIEIFNDCTKHLNATNDMIDNLKVN